MSDSVLSVLEDLDRSSLHAGADIPSYSYPLKTNEQERFHDERGYESSFQDDSYGVRVATERYQRPSWRSDYGQTPYDLSPPVDAFDQELLALLPEERQQEAAAGRARLSLPARHMHTGRDQSESLEWPRHHNSFVSRARNQAPSKLQLDKYAFDLPHQYGSSSSPGGLPSSPSFKASQRRSSTRLGKSGLQETVDEPWQTQSLEVMPATSAIRSAGLHMRSKALALPHAPPSIQGIQLVPTSVLPDRFRAVFPMPLFNAVQSKCFPTVYETNDNLVLSAPTGSGKTCVLELAICRSIRLFASGDFKIVYQAPTKSLCSERQRDWQAKFAPLDLRCAELTGDTDQAQLKNVQNASIIITTPEKWDSITRKWKDHEKLMRLIKLFLIDEVHILKEDRGATLEAVVSRMKSVGSDVRFIALSATVPNSEDIATWLGKDPVHQDLPAIRERFGEEFRLVKLQKHVLGLSCGGNDFVVDRMLDSKLPEVISKYSQRKPIMIFCCTRASTTSTAKQLANWWNGKGPRDRYWSAPARQLSVVDEDLRYCISSGVAFHHAGLDQRDRMAVEEGYLRGLLSVICCTSTLAVGVNLPCHFVIIKNTANFRGKEYADLEVVQMLGRAGRPQFDDSGVAVILTKMEKVKHYEKMISGQEILESRLHLNLIEHLNAEVGLGTVTDVHTARRWLASTFLFVRLKQNPDHYRLAGDLGGRDIEEKLDRICNRDLDLLAEHQLVEALGNKTRSTELGDAMARYYVQFETMKTFLQLPRKSRTSAILSALAQAAEFKEIRFRSGEKPSYKEINTSDANPVKYRIPVNLDSPAHKVSLIVQATLGGIDFPTLGGKDKFSKHKVQFSTDQNLVFQHASRLIRCIIDIQLHLGDSTTALHALALARSLSARVWDDSPLQMKQFDDIGVVAVRRLVNAGIRSVEDLENSEPQRIDAALSRRPGFGFNLLNKLKSLPKLRVSLKLIGQPVIRPGECVRVRVKAEVGFLNDKVPVMFNKRLVYVCLLAETSDGNKVHFCRMSAQKLQNNMDVLLSVDLTSPAQEINCYVMCDEIAGTQRQATLKPDIRSSSFPQIKPALKGAPSLQQRHERPSMNTSKRRIGSVQSTNDISSYDDDGLDDEDLIRAAGDDGFDSLDSNDHGGALTESSRHNDAKRPAMVVEAVEENTWEPQKLPNGKWACNHKCKDKGDCKHLCCREGCDNPPRRPAKAKASNATQAAADTLKAGKASAQTKLNLQPFSSSRPSLRPKASYVEHVDLSQRMNTNEYAAGAPGEYKKLPHLHSKAQNTPRLKNISSTKPLHAYADGAALMPPFATAAMDIDEPMARPNAFDGEGSAWWEDLPSPSPIQDEQEHIGLSLEDNLAYGLDTEAISEADREVLDAAGSGLGPEDDSADARAVMSVMKDSRQSKAKDRRKVAPLSELPNYSTNMQLDEDDDLGIIPPSSDPPELVQDDSPGAHASSNNPVPRPPRKERSLFLGTATSSPTKASSDLKPSSPTRGRVVVGTRMHGTKRRILTASSDGGNSQSGVGIFPEPNKRARTRDVMHNEKENDTYRPAAHAALRSTKREGNETKAVGKGEDGNEEEERKKAEEIVKEKGYEGIDIALVMGLQGYVEFV